MSDNEIQLEAVPEHKIGDIELVQRAVKVLTDHYPGYLWRVGINDEKLGGVMYIINQTINAEIFSNSEYAYILYLTRVYSDPSLNCVMRAGGEILERANMTRGRFRNEQVKKIDGLPDIHQPINGEKV